MYTLLVNNKSLKDYGLAVKSISRPLLPARNYSEIEVQGRNGAIIEVGAYRNRTISAKVTFIEKNLPDIREKAREIAYLLSGKKKLIFTDEPEKYYRGILLDETELDVLGSTGEATLTFLCEPFAESVTKHRKPLNIGHNRDLNYQGTAETPTRIILRNTGTRPITNIKIKQIKKGD